MLAGAELQLVSAGWQMAGATGISATPVAAVAASSMAAATPSTGSSRLGVHRRRRRCRTAVSVAVLPPVSGGTAMAAGATLAAAVALAAAAGASTG